MNYNLKTITEPKVVDTILDNQQFIEDSLTVFKMKLTGEENGTEVKELIENVDYKINWNPERKEITVTFTKEIDSPYLITYQTSLEGQQIKNNYSNTAIVLDNNTKVTKLEPVYRSIWWRVYEKLGEQKTGKLLIGM